MLAPQDIDLHLTYGAHGSAEDARQLRDDVERWKPTVYVQETADVLEEERFRLIERTNQALATARRDPAAAAGMLIALQQKPMKNPRGREFTVEERRILLALPRTRWFAVEGYSAADLAISERVIRESTDPRALEAALLAGAIDRAIAWEGSCLRAVADVLVRPRDARISQGLCALAEELPRVFPELRPRVRVLARLGSSHGGVSARVRRAGLPFSERRPELGPSERAISRWAEEPGWSPSRGDLLLALLEDMMPVMLPGTRVVGRRADVLMSRLGGPAHFEAMLRDAARACSTVSLFAARLSASLRPFADVDHERGGVERGRPPRMELSGSAAPRTKVGRNDACPCGSGKKHKKCCGA